MAPFLGASDAGRLRLGLRALRPGASMAQSPRCARLHKAASKQPHIHDPMNRTIGDTHQAPDWAPREARPIGGVREADCREISTNTIFM